MFQVDEKSIRYYYIAYGSNLSVEQMKVRCPDAEPIGTATLQDWELVFRYHATIEPKQGAKVPVVVWAISPKDEKKLDHYEGYPTYYDKKRLIVSMTEFKTHQRRDVNAMVYIMPEGRAPIEPPSGDYLNVIAEGYDRFKFNETILRKAVDEAIFQYMSENNHMEVI